MPDQRGPTQRAEPSAAARFLGYRLPHLRAEGPLSVRGDDLARSCRRAPRTAVRHIERCVIVQSAVHGIDNRVVEDALAEKHGAYLGVALLPASVADTELRGLDRLGFCGVRFNFIKHIHQIASIEQVLGLAPRLADIGWHLQIQRESSLIEAMAPALERSPVPVVIDHIGRVDAALGLQQAAFQRLSRLLPHDRFWVKVSGCDRITRTRPPYADALPFARKLATDFPDRVLWGSDWSTSSPRWHPRRSCATN
jgi:2-pyrone-4,6-dicarboxylate lactonase